MNRPTLTRRRLAAPAFGTAGALALAACGASQSGTPGQPAALPAKRSATIRVTARQAQEADMWPIRVPQFTEKYPHLKLEPDLHAGNIQEKQAALIAAGELGDVAHTHFSAAQPQRLYLGKSMVALDPFIAKDKVDLKGWYPMAIDAGR